MEAHPIRNSLPSAKGPRSEASQRPSGLTTQSSITPTRNAVSAASPGASARKMTPSDSAAVAPLARQYSARPRCFIVSTMIPAVSSMARPVTSTTGHAVCSRKSAWA